MAKFYKEVARCRVCNKKYTVDKDSANYSRYYCPEHARARQEQASPKDEE